MKIAVVGLLTLSTLSEAFTVFHPTRRISGRRGRLTGGAGDSPTGSVRLPTSTAEANGNGGRITRKKQKKQKRSFKKKGRAKSSYNNNSNNNIARWKVLNQRLVRCEDANELLKLLQNTENALTQRGGGGALNMVNFCTALHRLAKHSLQSPRARAPILTDPRFALLMASLAEAMTPDSNRLKEPYTSRNLSNLSWALVKLKIVPPASALPLLMTEEETLERMRDASGQIRQVILEEAKARRSGAVASASSKPWISVISKLAGVLVDHMRLQVVQTGETSGFQQQELSNLLWSWGTSFRAESEMFGQVILMLIHNQPAGEPLEPQNWSNACWAAANAKVHQNHEDLLDFVAQALEEDETFAQRYKPQEQANQIYSAAKLLANSPQPLGEREQQAALKIERAIAKQAIRRAHQYHSQEVSNILWAMATLGFGLEPSPEHAKNNYIVLPSDDLEGDRQTVWKALGALVSAALNLVHRATSQELNNMAWSLARLLEVDGEIDEKTEDVESLLHAIGQQLSDPRRTICTQDISMTLWGFAKLKYVDPDIYRRLARRLMDMNVSDRPPQEVANTVYALANSEIELLDDRDAFDTTLLRDNRRPRVQDPVMWCFGMAAEELMRRPEEFKPQEIKDSLWSFSKLGIRHPNLFRSIAEHLVGNGDHARGLSQFSPQALGNLAHSFARQAQFVGGVVARRNKSDLFTSSTNGRLAVYTTAYFDIGEALLQRLFVNIAETGMNAHKQLSIQSPQDLSNTAWTFAVLGFRHETFLEALAAQLQSRIHSFLQGADNSMTRFEGQEISNLVWAFASLNFPVKDLLDGVDSYVCKLLRLEWDSIPSAESISRLFKQRKELASLAWSCAVLDVYPKRLMTIIYTGLMGPEGVRDPRRMAEIFDDSGLQQEEVMTMAYVHLALLQKDTVGGLSLPQDFPEKWQSSFDPENLSDTATSDLRISTSKMQRAVSDTFIRIGFAHVEEHIISMKDLSTEYGLDLPPKAMDVLSIDIADIGSRIAVEVDGPTHYACQIDEGLETTGFPNVSNRGKLEFLEYQFGWNGSLQRPNGPTALKQRLLRGLGWKVISIPFWEFYSLGGDAAAEEEYCRRVLETNGLR